jgi:hypothetical protein
MDEAMSDPFVPSVKVHSAAPVAPLIYINVYVCMLEGIVNSVSYTQCVSYFVSYYGFHVTKCCQCVSAMRSG